MESRKFPSEHLARLSDPARLEALPPNVLWDAAGVGDEAVVVDVGAGTGLFAFAFARIAPHALIYAADVSPATLGALTSNLPRELVGRVVPVLASETGVPLADRVADLVVMIAVFHELEDPEATLAEARRLLNDEGRLLIVDWRPGTDPEKGPPASIRVPAPAIAAAVEAAGFTRVETPELLETFSVVTADAGGWR